eukprot:2045458-Rhodomonas_salina.2
MARSRVWAQISLIVVLFSVSAVGHKGCSHDLIKHPEQVRAVQQYANSKYSASGERRADAVQPLRMVPSYSMIEELATNDAALQTKISYIKKLIDEAGQIITQAVSSPRSPSGCPLPFLSASRHPFISRPALFLCSVGRSRAGKELNTHRCLRQQTCETLV